nr:immunoglobulin light chain junction region [Macaca mulatta]MOW34213.1 immunoglobulin light chain junction region [Macaca mulatta]MOW34403.1 immunoglobulin light chain junction region [Macaca mulatta]MOW34455.1 immunoglobulin light chain junction region [Macaca mulatta]MOW35932.1 immunoglobulin light chain junction region [Macaca mulatta]
CQKYSTPPYTF